MSTEPQSPLKNPSWEEQWKQLSQRLSRLGKSEFWQHKIWQPPHFTGFKILSVLLALCLWAYVTVSQNPLTEGVYSVPVSIYNLSMDLAQPDTNYQVQIRVQASSSVINALTSHDFEAYVDLEGFEAGEATAEIRVVLPENVSVVSMSQDFISLSLEKSLSDSFNISAHVNGSPAENYSCLSAVLNPEVVTVYGSAGKIDAVSQVCVYADVNGLNSNYNKNLPVIVLDKDGNDISEYFTINPASVNVLVPVVYQQPESSLSVRPVTKGEPASGYQISRVVVEPATVTAFGELSALNSLYYLETEPIDVSGLNSTANFTVRLKAVAGVTLSVETVTVVVQVDSASAAAITKDSVVLRNLPEGLSAAVSGSEYMVNVSGASSFVDALAVSEVELYVDCSAITAPGDYQLNLQAQLPANINLVSISPAAVTVTVTAGGESGATE